MKFIDFFAGIGGFRIGMEKAGHECIGFCEKDKHAQASYISMHLINEEQRLHLEPFSKRKRIQEIISKQYIGEEWFAPDISYVCAKDLPKADCWCFGAPCTSFSMSGNRKGMDGESGIVKEIFRILQQTCDSYKPEWLIYENVKGMRSSNRGLDFLSILSELDECGYDSEWQLFNTADYLPQWRERIYLVGHLRKRGERKIFPIASANQQIKTTVSNTKCGTHKKVIANFYNAEPNGVSRTIKQQYQKNNAINFSDVSKRSASAVQVDIYEEYKGSDQYIQWINDEIYAIWNKDKSCYSSIRKITPLEAFRLQGFADDMFYRAAFVNSNLQLYRQAGNAASIPIVYEIAKRIK